MDYDSAKKSWERDVFPVRGAWPLVVPGFRLRAAENGHSKTGSGTTSGTTASCYAVSFPESPFSLNPPSF